MQNIKGGVKRANFVLVQHQYNFSFEKSKFVLVWKHKIVNGITLPINNRLKLMVY